MNIMERTENLLRRCGVHPDSIILDEAKSAYVADMIRGLSGDPSSLKMLPAYLSAEGCPAEDETVIAVDIGGTNLRIALTRFSEGTLEILDSIVTAVPGQTEELTKDGFFREIALQLRPFIDKSRRVSVSFSHAAEILPNREGRLLSFSKEIRVSGAAGVEITGALSKALYDLGYREEKEYMLLNDTAAVLLGGAASFYGQNYDGYIGFVLGTGMNLSYIEKTTEIKKIGIGYPRDTMIVNTESGYFSGAPTGVLDKEVDNMSVNPGLSILEKMTSGRYLGQLILLALKEAAAENLLSEATEARLMQIPELPLADISEFLKNEKSINTLSLCCATDSDRTVLTVVADRLIDRSAKLAVMAAAAVMEKTNTGHGPERPVCLVAEGSTFHKLYSFKEKFNTYLDSYIKGQLHRYCRVVQVENATILGGSFAALVN